MFDRNSREFARGRVIELAISHWLQSRGWFVIPSYDYAGDERNKPPRLKGLEKQYAIPDLDVAKSGRRLWVEVKTRARPTFNKYSRDQRLEHGFGRLMWLSYLQVRKITGTEVWVFVLEERDFCIIGNTLTKLGDPRLYLGDKMDPGGMAFFPRDRFRLLGVLNGNVIRRSAPTL
jgi:hypothetical protein